MTTRSTLILSWMLALVVLAGAAARAQRAPATSCSATCKFGEDLVEPYRIEAQNGVLDTMLRVEMKKFCVPVWIKVNDQYTCSERLMELPTYGFPARDGMRYGFPAPTFYVHKPDNPNGRGDRIRVKLVNALPLEGPTAPDGCDPCLSAEECTAAGGNAPKCCKAKDKFPNCFHGDNTTNLHFHGTHVSPQAPQDFVLLQLQPVGSKASHTGPDHGRGTVAVGEYQYDVEPLRWTQPEGTHWYHPHKHGSTGLQVSSGMAGALIIEGDFDDWLRSYYGQSPEGRERLQEKVLVVQQIHPLNFFELKPDRLKPQPLVDGMAKPRIVMYKGQVQRWRFIGATMNGSAQISIDFNGPKDDSPLVSRQIAMDGIQFAPENYGRQPLLPASEEFNLSPGNRADFLVQAPAKEGTFEVTYDVFGQVEEGGLGRKEFRDLLEQLAPGADAEPALLTVRIVSCEEYRKLFPDAPADCPAMGLPTENEWPRTPRYLWDIKDAKDTFTLRFALKNPSGQPANQGQQPSQFYINLDPNENRQYNPECVDITSTIGTAEQWTITNETDLDPFHVFHIHTNPFQLIQNGPTTYTPPYIWMDAITLPAQTKGKVVIRQRFEEFTGEYVLHCHFLGHEDRGMMLGVQAVCPNGPEPGKDYYGVARTDNAPECVPGNYILAAPRCPIPVPPPK